MVMSMIVMNFHVRVMESELRLATCCIFMLWGSSTNYCRAQDYLQLRSTPCITKGGWCALRISHCWQDFLELGYLLSSIVSLLVVMTIPR
jgi:hypothetical protein